MANAKVKNGVTGIIIPLSFYEKGKLTPVKIPTQIAITSDSRTFDLDAEGIKNWLKNHEENSGFDAKEFMDEFFKEHAEKYAKMTLMLGYVHHGESYPITYELEKEKDKYKETLSVVIHDPNAQFIIDARCSYKSVPHWEFVIHELQKAKNYFFHDHVVLPDVLFYLKQELNHYEPISYNLLVRHKNNIAVIEG